MGYCAFVLSKKDFYSLFHKEKIQIFEPDLSITQHPCLEIQHAAPLLCTIAISVYQLHICR
jgi:hypothetical protein